MHAYISLYLYLLQGILRNGPGLFLSARIALTVVYVENSCVFVMCPPRISTLERSGVADKPPRASH